MNPKMIISFLLGAGMGTGISFIFLKKKYEKKADEEIAEMRELLHQYRKYGCEMKEYADEMYESVTGKEPPEKGFTDEEIRDYISEKELKSKHNSKKEINIVNLQRHTDINRRKDDEKIDEVEKMYEDIQGAILDDEINDYQKAMTDYTRYSQDKDKFEHPEDEIGMPRIEIITEFEYDNDNVNHEKQEVVYYEGDDTLCNEHDIPIDNPEELVGSEALFAFDSPDEADPDLVHVRNNKTGVDYKITRYEGTFAEISGVVYD